MSDLPHSTLASRFRGRLLTPAHADYDAARVVWNGAFDRRPALIAQCSDAADVVEAVRYARRAKLPIAVRGGGHSIPGHSMVEGGVVVDLSRMKAVHVDAGARTVRAEAGLTWGELDRATAAFGLATTGGQISHTGIAGLTLGGGMGWLMRKLGLTVDNLLEVELVTADGDVLRASATENPELFWGLRGGGGNFGVATRFTYRLHPLPSFVGGPLVYRLEDAEDVLRFWSKWAPGLPDEAGAFLVLMHAPPAPFLPADMHGKPALFAPICYAGPPAEADAAFAPLRAFRKPVADLVGPVPYPEFQRAVDDTVPYGRPYYLRASHLGAFPDDAARSLVEAARAMTSPWSQLHVGLLGGAVARVPEDATAFPTRDAPFTLVVHTGWDAGADSAPHVAWVKRTSDALAPHARGAYVNHLGDEGAARVRAAYGEAKLARLVALKDRYDPTNAFRLNQNVAPSRERA